MIKLKGIKSSKVCTIFTSDEICLRLKYFLHLELGYILVAVGSSGILKEKQKLGVTFNSNKLGIIDFTKFSKLAMRSA